MRDLLKAAETVVNEYKGVASPHFHSLLVRLEEAIAAAKERSEWVPVAERLPVIKEGKRRTTIWVNCSTRGVLQWRYDGFLGPTITHWAPINPPAPPRSES